MLARRLRTARLRAKMTQERVAFLAGTSPHVYWRYEHGHILPSTVRLYDLASILGCSTDYLLGLDEALPPAVVSDDPPPVRRLLRRIRRLSPHALRLVQVLLEHLRIDADPE